MGESLWPLEIGKILDGNNRKLQRSVHTSLQDKKQTSIKEYVFYSKISFQILEMMLKDCQDIYRKRYERRQRKRQDKLLRRASNVLFIGSILLLLVFFVLKWTTEEVEVS